MKLHVHRCSVHNSSGLVLTDASDSEDEEELQSESGLGESPEEDLIEDTGHPLSDDEKEEEKEDTSDSDAPEDMGFMANQQAEKKMMQSILDEIRKGKNEKKNKRRMKDEMFKMQKVRQLQTCTGSLLTVLVVILVVL